MSPRRTMRFSHLLSGTSRRFEISTLFAILGFLLAISTGRAASPPFPVEGKTAPDFTLTDQTGHQIRLSQFRGKLVLLNFIYTHCVDVCPITTANLARVQNELIKRGWWAKDIVFISVTTDPERDTPAVFLRYAARYHADPKGWHFLTGKPSAVKEVHKRYGIVVVPAEHGLQEHYLPTFVINRAGVVLGAYGVNPNPQDVLKDLEHLR